MRRVKTTFVAGLWLAIVGSASGQTVKTITDSRGGSATAAVSSESTASAGYAITPRSLFTPIDFDQTVTDGGATATLASHSRWLDLSEGMPGFPMRSCLAHDFYMSRCAVKDLARV